MPVHSSGNILNQPLTRRRALACLGLVALAAVAALAGPRLWHWWETRPKSAAAQASSVYRYLKKRSGRSDFSSPYDFTLRATVTTLQTNSAQLRAELGVLQTNATALNRDARALGREVDTLTEGERGARRRLATLTERLAEQQRRLRDHSLTESNLLTQLTNGTPAPNRVEQWKRQLATVTESLTGTRTNLAALEQQRKEAEQDHARRLAEVEAKRALWATRQAEAKAMEGKLNERSKDAQSLRRELGAREQALNSQADSFNREIRKSLKEAASYQAIYAAIGQLLWTGERLLQSEEPRVRRQGAQFLEEAAQSAGREAEDADLASRICQAWIWPNLDRFNLPGQGTAGADNALGSCNGIFQRAGATELVERNYRMMLTNAPTPRRLDAIRYNLAGFLEDQGSLQEALRVYRQIEDTNYLKQAERRIGVVGQKLGQGR